MSSEYFEECEFEFTTLAEKIELGFREDVNRLSGDSLELSFRRIEADLYKLSTHLNEMKGELTNIPSNYKFKLEKKCQRYEEQLKQYNSSLSKHRANFHRSQQNINHAEASSFLVNIPPNISSSAANLTQNSSNPTHASASTPNPNLAREGINPRQTLLESYQTNTKINQSLETSHRIAHESEQIGVGILSELASQRETIQRTRGHLGETQDHLGKSSRLLRFMNRRIITDKAIMTAIILVEIFILALIVYMKFLRK